MSAECSWCDRPATTRLLAAVHFTGHGPERRYVDLCDLDAETAEREREASRAQ